MKKRVCSMLCAVLLLCGMTGTAMAAEAEVTAVDPAQMSGVLEQVLPQAAPIYPAEVRASEENGVHRLEKVYYLTAGDDPAAIPTRDFDREGVTYTLLDVLKNDQTETDTKDHIEVITTDSGTKDMAEIIKTLEPELEVSTEDGYSGILALNYTSITVEAAGYKTSSRTVSAQRTYPNLSDPDLSLIPKTIEESGRTLTLADVDWQAAATDHMDGYDLAMRYNAVAPYTGTATSKYTTGYTVTAEYGGEIPKSSCNTIVYTAVFSGVDNSPADAQADGSESDKTFNYILLLIPLGAVILGAAGYFGRKWYLHYQNKKRGYE